MRSNKRIHLYPFFCVSFTRVICYNQLALLLLLCLSWEKVSQVFTIWWLVFSVKRVQLTKWWWLVFWVKTVQLTKWWWLVFSVKTIQLTKWWWLVFSVKTVQRNAQWLSVVEVLWVRAWLAALTDPFLRLLWNVNMKKWNSDGQPFRSYLGQFSNGIRKPNHLSIGFGLQWGSEIRPFKIQNNWKSRLFEDWISDGLVFKGWAIA